jgi:threonine dehydratase
MELFFKCECLQRCGAFKFRGASNAIACLAPGEDAVATHSSGNHGAALALAARLRGVKAHVVMPRTAPACKRAAVLAYGGLITECEPTLAAREAALAEIVLRTGARVVHPSNDPFVIAGQGTAALELLDDYPRLDVVLAPVGGGGLLSGTALAAGPRHVAVKGVEPEGASDAYESFQRRERCPVKSPRSVADGLLTELGTRTFPLILRHVDDIVTVPDAAIVQAMRLLWQRQKLVVEPSGATAFAAVVCGKIKAERVGVILSGGNVDLDALPWR